MNLTSEIVRHKKFLWKAIINKPFLANNLVNILKVSEECLDINIVASEISIVIEFTSLTRMDIQKLFNMCVSNRIRTIPLETKEVKEYKNSNMQTAKTDEESSTEDSFEKKYRNLIVKCAELTIENDKLRKALSIHMR